MASAQNQTNDPRGPTPPEWQQRRLAQLQELFPEAFSEGKVDLQKLQAALGEDVETRPERYSFTWAGKRDAMLLLQTPSRATLVPDHAESVQFEDTGNIFIEGENLEVLKLLYKSYFGRVKMIYIDPPYNTGNDFIYPDNYADPLDTYLRLTGQKDGNGNLLTSNPETSGRYHSAWLSMMYPRLFLARQLLREDGVIFVSIDDHEAHNLRMMMNEVFGEENFVATFIWEKRTTRENRRVFSFNHDFIVCYARSKGLFEITRGLLPMTEEGRERYTNPDNDSRGDWQSVSLNAMAGHATPAQFYTIVTPGGRKLDPPPGRCWSVTQPELQRLIADNRVWFGKDGNNVPRRKVFLSEVDEGLTPHTLWKAEEVGTTDKASKELLKLFSGESVFETPKPVELVKRVAAISTQHDGADIVLDFFAGSCTTAQSVLELNREDGGNRHFLMVQLQEPPPEGSEARKAGYATIAAIGKERIRLVITKMQKEQEGKFLTGRETPGDLGFRVFKLATSNYRSWAGVPESTPQAYGEQIALYADPLVEGWTAENVLYEVAIREGYGLNCGIEQVNGIEGNTVYRVTDPDKGQWFHICLDDALQPATLKALELTADHLFICRDKALDDEAAANLALQCRLKTI